MTRCDPYNGEGALTKLRCGICSLQIHANFHVLKVFSGIGHRCNLMVFHYYILVFFLCVFPYFGVLETMNLKQLLLHQFGAKGEHAHRVVVGNLTLKC